MIRLTWALKLVHCLLDGQHHYPDENSWCPECDTGQCLDCNMPIFWHELEGQHPVGYRHIDPDKTCFLIQDNGGVEDDPTNEA